MAVPEISPQFSQPVRQAVQILIVVVLVALGGWFIYPSVEPVVLSNPFLNGTIALVFVLGVLACFLQVAQLSSSVRWIEAFARDHLAAERSRPPRLLAPLASLLRSRGVNRQISSTSAGSILESVATRIEEARDVTRYIVNLLIFLGLLGTFYGLATTVPAVVETIRSLAPQEGETGVEVFAKLMNGLEAQLGGMGTAFGSSLLGLAGSLVVGLLELFASRGQNRFYRELEEWLSSITRLGFAGGETEVSGEMAPLYAVLEHMAEQMETMRDLYVQSDASRAGTDARLADVAAAVSSLTGVMQDRDGAPEALAAFAKGQDRLIEQIGQGQEHLVDRITDGQERMIAKLSEQAATPAPAPEPLDPIEAGIDAESRMRLRSIDVQMLRILEEIMAGRQETVAELRDEIGALARELRASREAAVRAGPVLGSRD
jgi:HAMP domain-containing protein